MWWPFARQDYVLMIPLSASALRSRTPVSVEIYWVDEYTFTTDIDDATALTKKEALELIKDLDLPGLELCRI